MVEQLCEQDRAADMIAAPVPAAPGSSEIPAGHVRLYHYTGVSGQSDLDRFEAAEALRRNGIDIRHAKGNSYGEPNVVWASTQRPDPGKVYAEFSVPVDDPRWKIGRPDAGVSAAVYQDQNHDSYFNDSIRPDELIAVHEPWHERYRYLQRSPAMLARARAGEFDHLIGDNIYGPAVLKVKSE